MSPKTLNKLIFFSLAGIILVISAYNLWAYQGTIFAPFLKNSRTDDPHQPLADVLKSKGIATTAPDLWLEIKKSEHRLRVYAGKTLIKSYKIALGKDYLADKQKAGDRKTPVGEFIVTEKKKLSPPKRWLGSRLLLLNYPNREDALRGLHEGLITGRDFLAIEKALKNKTTPPQDTPLGGGISIHGGGGPLLGSAWTKGSIGMYSKDMEELFDLIPLHARVVIRK